ncbi:DNA sulfur modification protein DndB [Herbaspirillum sp. RTI4]|uniref:DNA sulfur modification protein DndB n=1 Tax=Herbaspirillum sp. RTI4 TaxID=3048640 RepID=UPI002AB3CD5C|nr:DNA sulfur modification protein DndB [Herbaspirillum sp. RTI4]MDY7577259.1 DNA sulfur modification protein DndB [Herbaspirillum sp. RTI4]MEA9980549.1 DNA sulfur modification protein DndB [Herbaspirillum sp. RTI4]
MADSVTTTLLPAIRSHIGDWNFYVTALTLNDVATLIKDPDEIHERKQLSTWIQREAINEHSEAIAKYILANQQRFLGAIIIGIYDGNPTWAPLDVSFKANALNATIEQQEQVTGRLGFLQLSGTEKLFAIDGQHRVAGIKNAVQSWETDDAARLDEVAAIFVGHDASTPEGKIRTRRLFTTVNKKAKRVSTAGIIALDEDNGFAVVTRFIIDTHWLFEDNREHISYTSTGSLSANNPTTITSVVGLYEIVKELYGQLKRKDFESERPSDPDIESFANHCIEYLDALLTKIPEYKQVFIDQKKNANEFRSKTINHLLFRPAGQRVFARAASLLIERGNTISAAVAILSKVDLNLFNPIWHHLLWNPISEAMISTKLSMAETQLLLQAGQAANTKKNEADLRGFLTAITNQSV